MLTWTKKFVSVAVLIACLGGCTGGVAFNEGNRSDVAAVSPRSRWKIQGNFRSVNDAIDGSNYTAAVISPPYDGATLTIDLGKPCLFNMVVLDHGQDQYNFSKSVAVQTSMDGRYFAQQMAGPGQRRVTTLCLISPVLARYVRIQALAGNDRPWSIAEIYVR